MSDYYSEDCAVCKRWHLPVIGNSTKFYHVDECHKTVLGYCEWLNIYTHNDFTCDGFYRRGKARKKVKKL